MTPTTLPVGDAKLALLNAPDTTIGEKDAGTRAGQAFRIQLVQDLTKEMKDHLRHGKAQLVLGTNSHIRFGNNTFVPIASQPETFRREIYAQDVDQKEGLLYKGLVSHTFAETKEREVVAQADAAMLQLNVTMANLQKEKEQNKAQSVNAIMPNNKKAVLVRQPAVFNKFGPRSSQSALSKGLAGLAHDSKSSPGLLGIQSGSVAMTTACRKVLVHLLAVKPLEISGIVRRTNIPKDTCMQVLQKIANPDKSSLKWKLTDKAYKELEPYDFQYESEEDRAAAIECAIVAFDRQRISKDDKIWQNLLAKSERGSGKILSKLNLTGAGSSTPIVPRPSTKSSSPANDSVSGVLSADESRPQAKFGAAAEVRAKQIFNRKTIPKPSSSSSSSLRPNKATTSEANGATAAVSDNDMAKRGVAQRVLKRKASETKFKSDERIDDSDVNDDSLIVKKTSHDAPDRKKLKTNGEGTKTTRTERADSNVPAKSKEMTKQITKPQTSTPMMKPKVTTTTVSPPTATTTKKTSAPVPSADGFFGAASSAPKIRKVTRVTGSASDGEKQKSANTSSTVPGNAAPRQHQRQKSQEQPQPQKKSNATEDEKLKPKQTATNTVKGLAPSPNLPPKPPRSISSSNVTTKSQLQTSSARPGQTARPRTNEGLAGSAHADKQTQKQTGTAGTNNAQLHQRIPSTSTISSSSTTSTIFTPPTHRNSTSSSLSSSSSMVFTRSDAKALKRERDDDVKTEQPTTKKVKKSEVTKPEDSTNSSPLSELASVSTPSQSVAAARSPLPPPLASKAKTSIKTASQVQPQAEHVSTQAQNVLVPTTTTEQPPTNQVSAKRRRLASLRMQFYGLFSSWISARVAFQKDESNATDKIRERLKAQHTKVKAMEVEIRNLMDEVEDFTMWDGVPAKFVTQHEDFLRDRLRTLHPIYNEKWDELEKMRTKEERGENYDELKKELCKRLEEIEDLRAILHPAQEWEFVDDAAAAIESSQ